MRIHRVSMRGVNSWLAESGGRWLMIDAGKPSTVGQLFSGIESAGCGPEKISLLVISHAHYDHVGGAGPLKKKANVPVAIHRADAGLLRSGGFEISDGLNFTGRLKAFLGRNVAPRRMFAFEPVEPDVIVDRERRIDDFGFAAVILHTPGHSNGSISVLTDEGDLFPGDLAITQPMSGIWRHMPIYGSSVDDIKNGWRSLLERGARHVYPSHGEDFPASELRQILKG